MEIINTNNNTPIFSWCPTVEDGTKDQIIKLASYPFVRKAALMPDAHTGVTMPIGGVIGCKDVVVPNCVGVDIGCGMCAMRTNLKREEVESQGKFIHNSISRGIPVGFSHNNDQRCNELVDVYSSEVTLLFQNILNNEQKRYDTLEPILNAEYNIYECLGTLGGGNHFIEIQYDEENNVWAMVHSGSRNIGKQICDCFNEIAVKNCKSWYSHGNGEVGFLPVDSQVGQDFIHWMTFAMGFASLNRVAMMDEIFRNLKHIFPHIVPTTRILREETLNTIPAGKEYGVDGQALLSDRTVLQENDFINIHHNYTSLEHIASETLWIHRKGATQAEKGGLGVIPGSMGTPSYIVLGTGNDKAMRSCSHGAGRLSSRTAFNQEYSTKIDVIEDSLKNIVHSTFKKSERGKNKGVLDVSEAPQAYKNIDEVMANQTELVKPLIKLMPMINIKG